MNAPLPDLSQDDKRVIFDSLDLNLNRMVLEALLYGLYTGIVVVTLWNIISSPKRLRSTFLRTIIIVLYVLSTIGFAVGWAFEHRAFIKYGNNYYSVFIALQEIGPWWKAYNLMIGITGGISTLLVDITIIWRCWTLWDRQWQVALIPIMCAGTAMKVMQILSTFHGTTQDISKTGGFAADIDWALIYLSLTLATTIVCTLLIVYRIIRHAPRMNASRKIIEMLIESSAMYSLSLIVYLALVSRNSESSYYADIIMAYTKAIAPTLLVGRLSAHANASSRRQKMIAMWENHPPLVGCFREGDIDNSHVYHCPDGGHRTVSGSSREETV
ncbi:hypothetical protein ARMSODRAFT_1024748 [Armillaria solidipes]|uniref:Family A G protein-coupled receptor-like protein n=1 Tax=Armillaria solidipes TaxID=1076256 RepID=A0A2H3BD77_9AGAR|nr:hypothetical protein ARMSODRAFT_1024748 [Armillaria solidipes]